ncbi:cytochrome c-type biogenesis protein CcmF [Fluviicoccus keumensis]|uniref:Cytochrome c-type biogenesis protein CcmF n=1 Tax=Fluviicoccus keumensis TaxID=1435465 RepID=A0A4Q7YKT6_9GAMM|nr:heme lyase CcmF/NrfE family subunit [Fluviicoccus keumensis]RZU37139.1 cytochrome c-type biogenesis protein CcmF [Fluviicoccus keumensis]
MIAELGHFALVLAFVVALLQAVLPLVGVHRGHLALQRMARTMAPVQFLCLLLSFLGLTWAFIHNDFTLDYVSRQSNTQLPIQYKISAVWGGHEGSLLLWVTVLSAWGAAVALFGRGLPREMIARVLAIMGMVNVAMMAFVLMTSNPFRRLLPDFPMNGADLNPLLQDPGLIVHPPLLYMGYVGFTVPFAFAMAGLLGGRLDSAWARWSRPWTVAAWSFLSLGIALGSWWAYYELGWGGWWFWDPVENASFMPWLAGTALVHSLAVSEKRGVFKAWTVMLAILAFALSLLGTFLVRSGVLTSVHAFAADPARGLFVLGILFVVIGSSLLLFALRAGHLNSESRYQWISREGFLLANNLLLITATTVVFLGTLFPLVADALKLGKISVGPPYFNTLFTPLALVLLAFLGIGPLTRWKRHDLREQVPPFLKIAVASLVLGVGLPLVFASGLKPLPTLTLVLCLWVFLNMLNDIRVKAGTAKQGFAAGLRRLSASYWGMQLAHTGLLVTVVGIALTTAYSTERDVRLSPGSRVEIQGYGFEWAGVRSYAGPNFSSEQGEVRIYRGDTVLETLYPEKRRYNVRGQVMTEAAIDPGLFRDIYVAMGEPLEGNAWAVRVYVKPFIRWTWLGALIMVLGGMFAISDRRYRMGARASRAIPAGEKA